MAVVPLVSTFNCLAYAWMIKDQWKVTWHDPNRMLNERLPDMTPMGCWMKGYLTWPQWDVEWKVTWHDPNGMLLDVSVSTRKKERYNI